MGLDNFKNKLSEILSPDTGIKYNEPMKNHTSFKVGGPADVFIIPKRSEDISRVIKLSCENGMNCFIMGNGSNLIVRDGGYRGVIIKLTSLKHIHVEGTNIIAQAGALLSAVSSEAMNNSLKGMEFASGIPGTVGGAVAMNAGAYGPEIKDIILWANVADREGNILKLSKEELELGYRDSIIQRKNYVVLEACFGLEEGEAEKVKARMDELNKRRADRQPLTYPSAGSTFKRPNGYFAAQLIDESGLKGTSSGGAMVSEKHAGFIINYDNATAADILNLIEIVQNKVRERYHVDMEPEVKIIGVDSI
jgi:UDP-N-acetylmuramate dehydrogenase